MKTKNIIIIGLIMGVLFLVFDMIVGILSGLIFSQYAGLPIWKTPPNMPAGVIFDFINGFILVLVYRVIYPGIPKAGWQKGLIYGIIAGLFRVVMMSFSTIVMYDIPLAMVGGSLILGLAEIILLGVILAVIYEKLKK